MQIISILMAYLQEAGHLLRCTESSVLSLGSDYFIIGFIME